MRSFAVLSTVGLIVLVSTAVRAEDKFDAAARAKLIAPWIDEQTFAIAHIDLKRVSIESLIDQLSAVKLFSPEEIAGLKLAAGLIHQRLTGAGVKDGYVVFSLADGVLRPRIFAVIPIDAGSEEKAIRGILPIPAIERRGDVLLVAGDRDALARLEQMTSDPRPELSSALEAAGDSAAQLLILPPKHYRRVLEEGVGEFPKQLGGGPISVVTRGALWAAIGIDFPPHAALRVTVQSEDAHATEALHDKLAELFRLAGSDPNARKAAPNLDKLTALLLPKVEGNRLVVILDEKNDGIDSILTSLAPPIEAIKRSNSQARTANNLLHLTLAMHNYADRNKHFPLPASLSPQGKPLLSWRVQILPFIQQSELFKEFHHDEPWDSPHNHSLIDKMPEIYRLPISKNTEPGRTNYLLPVGNGAGFAADKPTEIKDITDGTSNTIMIVEVDDDHAAIWTKPDDWQFDPQEPAKGLGHFFNGYFNAAFFDGHTLGIATSTDPKTLKALFTRAAGDRAEGF
jgi:prepilin-type processing-associated H-X9-DG protein